jgi:hypothetical protein
MGVKWRVKIWAVATAFLLIMMGLSRIPVVFAAENQPPGPDRFSVIMQKFTTYEWWLTDREDNTVVCSLAIDHEGLPTGGDIYNICGENTYDKWIVTKACENNGNCSGYYLQFITTGQSERKISIKLPPPEVWISLEGCDPDKSTYKCDSQPILVLSGEEPIEGEHITGLAGDADGKPFTCDPTCRVNLGPTDDQGMTLSFWAYSSYGDSSVKFTARIRVAKSTDNNDQSLYVDVLSTQWRGNTPAACSQIWNKFPPVGGNPDWLSTPQQSKDLSTNVSYEYLAAHLIKNGVVDASNCADGGIDSNGMASVCGVESARPAVKDWQNRFDSVIFLTAQQTGVPAKLLKNIFARESQFWPGARAGHPEAGLGQMTEGGADTLLTWNPQFFEQFCPTVLDQTVCESHIYPIPESSWKGIGLDDTERTLLQASLIQSVDAKCPDCLMGIDFEKTDASIGVFAQLLLASCQQTAKVIDLNYSQPAEKAASFEDLWRFTLVNYNAGSGCLGLSVDETSRLNEPLDWEHLSENLTPVCSGAIEYVNSISGTAAAAPSSGAP